MLPVRSLVLAGLAVLPSCRAFQPTIPQRRGDPLVPPSPPRLSLAEEFPERLEGADEPFEQPSHREALPPARPAAHIGDSEPRAIEMRGAPLSAVVHAIADQAGVNVALDPSLDRAVDVSFPSATLDSALQAVLAQGGLQLVEDPPGIFQVAPLEAQASARATFALQSAKAESVEKSLAALLGSRSSVVVEPSQNLLVVSGPRVDLEAAADYLDRLDRLQRQVLVEVRILEVTLDERFELGFTAAVVDGLIDGDTVDLVHDLSTPDDAFSLSFTSESGKVSAAIEAINRFAGTDLISSPRVLALSGTQAKIEVLREVPYVNTTSTTTGTTGGVGSTVQEEVLFKEAGIKLSVTPTIQAGGSVHVHIEQSLSEVVDSFNDIPVIDTRDLASDFLVGDRETVVLGGLMQKKKTRVDRGVPGLMDLPLIGRLFRSDEDSDQKRELLVFVTPRIVDGREAARLREALRQAWVERVRETGVESHRDEPEAGRGW